MRWLHIALPLFILQIMMLILFFVFGRYSKETMDISIYPLFQDVHVFVFIGFGYLMTFLKRYGYSSIGFNLLLSSFTIQWAILCNGFTKLDNLKMEIGITSLYQADIATVAVLISMGAVLGRTSILQLLLMGLIEIAAFTVNVYLATEVFHVLDPGGSILVHTFGAYFGLAVSFVINFRRESADTSLNESIYSSDLFAMIGTVFLWIFWPSFNGIGLEGDEERRAFINTYLALGSCTVTAFAMSSMLTEDYKFDMFHIHNATIAGGVGVGAVANYVILPWGAVLNGMICGVLVVLGFKFITPFLEAKCKIVDSCGVHNLHGMPGILSGILSIFYTFLVTISVIKDESMDFNNQSMQQLIGLGITLGVAILSGLLTGGVLYITPTVPGDSQYDDAYHWKVAE